MAALRQIKRRIKTAKNISQVTRAMEMVSAVKMRKLQQAALAGRPYISTLEKMVRVLASQKNLEEKHPYLLLPEKISKLTILIIAPQKGLCGALITNLARSLFKFFDAAKINPDISPLIYSPDPELAHPTIKITNLDASVVTLEKKAESLARMINKPIIASFNHTKKSPTAASVRPMADYLVKLFEDGQTDMILVAYSHFINTVTQKPVIRQFLPALPVTQKSSDSQAQFLFEPTADEVLHELFLRYCEATLYQIVLESLAAEHSARMVAMKNAHDNAAEIIDDLTLFYNKARQEAITNELLISASR